MNVKLINTPLEQLTADCLVIPVYQDSEVACALENQLVAAFLAESKKFGKANEHQLIFTQEQNLLLVGLGKKDQITIEKVQNYAGTAVKYFLKKTAKINIALPDLTFSPEEIGQALILGVEIAQNDPIREFKSDNEEDLLTEVNFATQLDQRKIQSGIDKGQLLAKAINNARTLGDLPANVATPTYVIEEVKKLVSQLPALKLTILDEAQAEQKGLGAFVAVAKGSDEPSFIAVLEYRNNPKSKDVWGLVGKGITFDSGGIYVKPAPAANDMKYDMCGAANVLGTIQYLAEQKVPVNVVAVMLLTENMSGGKAMRPGDVLRAYSGKTLEVLHTDAEGRLVLHDGVALIQKDYGATKIVDLGTLTGAIIVAIGDFYSGLFSNNDDFAQEFIEAGKKEGEKFWQMPMSEEYDEMISSKFADIANIGHGGAVGDKTADAIMGAKFIGAAVTDNRPWIHLDIAATAWDLNGKPYRNLGATGVGIKTLVSLISNDQVPNSK